MVPIGSYITVCTQSLVNTEHFTMCYHFTLLMNENIFKGGAQCLKIEFKKKKSTAVTGKPQPT